jgi:hypothetical protein
MWANHRQFFTFFKISKKRSGSCLRCAWAAQKYCWKNSESTKKNRLRAMRHSAVSILVVEQLREFESICKTVLAHESGDSGVQFNEKKRGSKISWHCPFKASISWSENFRWSSARGDAFFWTSYFLKKYYFGHIYIVLVRFFHILPIDGG